MTPYFFLTNSRDSYWEYVELDHRSDSVPVFFLPETCKGSFTLRGHFMRKSLDADLKIAKIGCKILRQLGVKKEIIGQREGDLIKALYLTIEDFSKHIYGKILKLQFRSSLRSRTRVKKREHYRPKPLELQFRVSKRRRQVEILRKKIKRMPVVAMKKQ